MTKTIINQLEAVNETNARKAHCHHCGRVLAPGEGRGQFYKNSGMHYLCDYCQEELHSYSASTRSIDSIDSLIEKGVMKDGARKNNVPKNVPITWGIEYEISIPRNDPLKDEKLNLAQQLVSKGFVPTIDGSVDIEYKSPILGNLNGLAKTFKSLIDDNNIISDYRAGTHCNVWCDTCDWLHWGTLQNYYNEVFKPLYDYISEIDESHGEFFGRSIHDEDNYYYRGFGLYHECMINMQEMKSKHVVELRVAKYQNANQYLKVMRFWGEVMQCIVTNFFNHCTIEENDTAEYRCSDYYSFQNKVPYRSNVKNLHKARVTGNKILKIYKKYRGL